MNDDIKLLGMLLGYARRRMVAGTGQVAARLGHDADAARAAVARLEARGLVYVHGAAVRLTLPGFAHAVAGERAAGTVARIGRPAHAIRSRAA
jgi:Mn-dependent DtxR family transcriptional regulator